MKSILELLEENKLMATQWAVHFLSKTVEIFKYTQLSGAVYYSTTPTNLADAPDVLEIGDALDGNFRQVTAVQLNKADVSAIHRVME